MGQQQDRQGDLMVGWAEMARSPGHVFYDRLQPVPIEAVDTALTAVDPAECVADKGYHSWAVLKALDDSPWKTRISEPRQNGFSRWCGDEAARGHGPPREWEQCPRGNHNRFSQFKGVNCLTDSSDSRSLRTDT